MTRSAALFTSTEGFLATAAVLYPFSEKCLVMWMPTFGPVPRMRMMFEDMMACEMTSEVGKGKVSTYTGEEEVVFH